MRRTQYVAYNVSAVIDSVEAKQGKQTVVVDDDVSWLLGEARRGEMVADVYKTRCVLAAS